MVTMIFPYGFIVPIVKRSRRRGQCDRNQVFERDRE